MWRALLRRYLTGRVDAAAVGLNAPASGAMALMIHAMAYLAPVILGMMGLSVLVAFLFGDTGAAGTAATIVILLGMVPTIFLMLESWRAISVWIGGRSAAMALHTRARAALDQIGKTPQ